MSDRGETDTGAIRRELGEVVGTLKMTVNAVDQLRESVERIVERAAFKADVEELKQTIDKDLTALKAEMASVGGKISTLFKWFWMGSGAITVLVFLTKLIQLPVPRIVFGG